MRLRLLFWMAVRVLMAWAKVEELERGVLGGWSYNSLETMRAWFSRAWKEGSVWAAAMVLKVERRSSSVSLRG